MADNVTANPGSGGSTFASDDIGGVQFTRVKLVLGADGVNDGDLASGNAMPVTGTVAVTNAGLTELAAAINGSVLDVNIAAQGGALTVASHAVTNAGTFAVQVSSALPAGANVIGHVIMDTTSTTTVTQATGTNLHMVVDSGTITAVTAITNALPAGTNGIGKLTANSGVIIGSVEIAAAQTLATVTTVSTVTAVTTLTGGGVAHDGADSGNPIKVGARAVAAEITPVTAGDRVDLLTDLAGKLIVIPFCNPENIVSGCISTAMTATTSLSLIASPGGALRNYITQITVSCAHATQGTDIEIQDGTGGTTFYIIPAAALYGGAAVTFNPPLKQPTAATGLFVKNTTTGSSTKISANGYKGV